MAGLAGPCFGHYDPPINLEEIFNQDPDEPGTRFIEKSRAGQVRATGIRLLAIVGLSLLVMVVSAVLVGFFLFAYGWLVDLYRHTFPNAPFN